MEIEMRQSNKLLDFYTGEFNLFANALKVFYDQLQEALSYEPELDDLAINYDEFQKVLKAQYKNHGAAIPGPYDEQHAHDFLEFVLDNACFHITTLRDDQTLVYVDKQKVVHASFCTAGLKDLIDRFENFAEIHKQLLDPTFKELLSAY